MKIFINTFKFFPFFIISSFMLADNIILLEDIEFLNLKEKKLFQENCSEDNTKQYSLKCINFLGINIFLNSIENSNLTKEEFNKIERKAFNYLNEAANQGYLDAINNLAWVYSNEKSIFFDLKKSSEYFNLLENLKNEKDSSVLKIDNKKIVSNSNKSFISQAIVSMYKMELYKSNSLENNIYITNREYEKSKRLLDVILLKSNLTQNQLTLLKKEIKKNNKIILASLGKDLKNYNKKYREQALNLFIQLEDILKKLN